MNLDYPHAHLLVKGSTAVEESGTRNYRIAKLVGGLRGKVEIQRSQTREEQNRYVHIMNEEGNSYHFQLHYFLHLCSAALRLRYWLPSHKIAREGRKTLSRAKLTVKTRYTRCPQFLFPDTQRISAMMSPASGRTSIAECTLL